MWAESNEWSRHQHHRELDMDLDDALREAAPALAVDADLNEASPAPRGSHTATSSNQLRSRNFDPAHQYWPSSAHPADASASRRHVPVAPALSRYVPPDQVPTFRPTDSHRLLDLPIPSATYRRHALRRHMHRSSRTEPPPYSGMDMRIDLVARNSLRDVIFSAMMSEHLTSAERVALLEDCRASAETSSLGIPFREILSEPIEPLGVSPLMYELTSCQPDWDGISDDTGLEVVHYLIEHWTENVLKLGKVGMLSWVIRTAFLRRFDEEGGNRLFKQLLPIIFEKQYGSRGKYIEYDISVIPLATLSLG
ncbi:hypothetical protein EW145_g5471 [Phellinidium pouzarii]|uniref:Uncharacterized protein n=1 Tax=Phellinidium pouzarii TaxID=167371 RepID=A0A4S4KZX0_9AGAM|nr:hypothetical protein EW145_g5471 [Phellinidium pouzarii]